jgi:hypothetical protein
MTGFFFLSSFFSSTGGGSSTLGGAGTGTFLGGLGSLNL